MTVTELNSKLTRELKAFIKQEGFYDSGTLYKSIKFNCTYRNLELKIKFKSQEYVQYLDEGDFLNDFFKKDDVIDLLSEFYSSQIEEEL